MNSKQLSQRSSSKKFHKYKEIICQDANEKNKLFEVTSITAKQLKSSHSKDLDAFKPTPLKTSMSKELQTCKKHVSKNIQQADHCDSNEYIRSLYKKYLGKQNGEDLSQRKMKTDAKDPNKLTHVKQLLYEQQPSLKKINSMRQPSSKTNSLAKHKKCKNSIDDQDITCQNPSNPKTVVKSDFYNDLKNMNNLQLMGDKKNSMIRAMLIIQKTQDKLKNN